MDRTTHDLHRSKLAASLASALLLTSAMANAKENPAHGNAAPPTTNLDTVTVTGSRIKRSQVEGPSPVTVISSEQIEREGFTTVAGVLGTITQNGGSVQNELNSAGGFTPNASPVNLRGLGPGRTLLLINGRRAADYPFPYGGQSNFQNLSNIPSAAVDRIEILAGGASAVYGSDAVAGVINVILKTDLDGDVVKLRGGTTTEGGGDFGDLQWVGGKLGDNWSLTYAFEYFADEPVFGYQRDFMDSRADNPRRRTIGQQPDATLRISRVATNTPNTYFAPPAGACDRFSGELTDFTFRAVNSRDNSVYTLGKACGYWTDVGYQTIANGSNNLSGYLYGTFDLGGGTQAWASLQGVDSKTKLGGGLESIQGPHMDGVGVSTTLYATNPGMRTNVNVDRNLTPQEVGGLENTLQKFNEKSLDLATGLRGTFAQTWDWDLTVGRAEYKATRIRPRLDGSAVSDWFFGPRLNATGTPRHLINLDRFYTPLTPEQYRSLSSTLRYEAQSWVNQGSFVLSGSLMDLPAGPLGFAAVLEGTQQGYELNSPDGILPQNRTVYNLTGTNGGGDRDRYAAAVEVRVPILSSLEASLAARYDRYDDLTDVDGAATWAAGLEWRPLESLLVRGNYSTSFKAPDMHYVFNEGSGSFSTVLDTYRCLSNGGTPGQTNCKGSAYEYSVFATSKGEPSLKEETGESWGAGLVWDATESVSMSLDYYDISIEDAVTTLSSGFILDAEGGCRTGLTRNRRPFQFTADSEFCREITQRVSRSPAQGELSDRVQGIRSGPVNQSVLQVSGLDAAIDWHHDAGSWGKFSSELAWSHTLQSERQIFATDPVDKDWRDDLDNFDFRSRVRGSVGWKKAAWSANVFMTRYGSLPNWQETGRIAPYFLWNVNAGKKITDAMTVTVFVNNIFNNFHPRDDGYDRYPYFWRAYSPIGREVSARMEYRFN